MGDCKIMGLVDGDGDGNGNGNKDRDGERYIFCGLR